LTPTPMYVIQLVTPVSEPGGFVSQKKGEAARG
jgi:hypothetical protein